MNPDPEFRVIEGFLGAEALAEARRLMDGARFQEGAATATDAALALPNTWLAGRRSGSATVSAVRAGAIGVDGASSCIAQYVHVAHSSASAATLASHAGQLIVRIADRGLRRMRGRGRLVG